MSQYKPPLFDRFIGIFSPKAQLKRAVARDVLQRKYEAAAKTRRTAGWSTSNSSSQKDTYQSLEMLRQRSRDLIQNNTHAKSAVERIVTNVVGKGILAHITDNKSVVRANQISTLFKEWALSTECDFDGTKNFYLLQRLVQKSVFENGECIVIKRYASLGDYKYIPLKLQILEPDHLDSTGFNSKPEKGNSLVQGVEFDQKGKRVAYHIFKDHPGGINPRRETIRIDASEVIHVYDELRAGQVRGVPYLAPAIIKIRDYDEYEDAQLVRQKVAACFAGFIVDMELPDDGQYSQSDQDVLEKIEPGSMEVLPPGKDIKFPTTPSVEGISEFSKISLRSIAAAIGISYEALTMDYSNVNFSSGRMGWIEMQRTIDDMRSNVLVPKFLDPVFYWVLDFLQLLGFDTKNINWNWTPPKREMIDPTKEIPAMVEGIKSGLLTYSQALQSLGLDPVEHMERIKNDFELLDKYGLKLASDPRNNLS